MLYRRAEMLGGRDVMRAALSKLVPLGRMATADDIARGIVFLASEEASMMTGSELMIDGGMTAWILSAFES